MGTDNTFSCTVSPVYCPLPSWVILALSHCPFTSRLTLYLIASACVHCELHVRALLAVFFLSSISCDLWAWWKKWVRKGEWQQQRRTKRSKSRSTGSWCIWFCVCVCVCFCFICCSFQFLPGFSCNCFPPPFLSLLSCPLSFLSMYIFRSRVIKSAPEGMCWNKISLILPCPHYASKTSNTQWHVHVMSQAYIHTQILHSDSFFCLLSSLLKHAQWRNRQVSHLLCSLLIN